MTKEYYEKNKDKIREYRRNYYKQNKAKLIKQNKERYEKDHDKILEYNRNYRENNKEKISEQKKKYYKKNRDKVAERCKNYYEKNYVKLYEQQKEYREKNYDKIRETRTNYRENNREFVRLGNRVFKYYKHYNRYISSLEKYLTIMKLGDLSLKKSIMVKLGHGTILEDEAVAMSGMTWSEEDQKELDEYLKRRKPWKRSPSKC